MSAIASSDKPTHIRPATVEELAAEIADASLSGKTFEISGGGTKLGLGGPVSSDAILDVSRLSRVGFYEPEELVMKIGVGMSLADIRQMLSEKRQRLAFDPPDYGAALGSRTDAGTIGGVVACNIAGPRRLHAGTPRDALLGFEGANGRGELFKAGGRTVKNVTGYDLSKLMAGSHGVLAVLTTVTLKVAPTPEAEATMLVRGLSESEAVQVMLDALGMSIELVSAAHLPEGLCSIPQTALRLEGTRTSVQARLVELKHRFHRIADVDTILDAESAAFWVSVRDLGTLRPRPEESIWRLLLPAAQAVRVVRAVGGRALYDWGGSQVFVAVPTAQIASDVTSIRELVGQVGGRANLFRAPDSVRREFGAYHPRPEIHEELNERTRQAFDPSSILNPGRLGFFSRGVK
jgi:glycolate oxidase FAD binding subunit